MGPLPHVIQLREAVAADCRMIWEWANDERTRSQSFTSSHIAWDNHVEWFDAALEDERHILLIGCDPNPVAIIRFQLESESATVSVNVAPHARGRGIGTAIIRAATTWFQERWAMPVVAWIKVSNAPSEAAFRAAGYEPVDPSPAIAPDRRRLIKPTTAS